MISNLCELYGELEGLRMTCPEERAAIDRRIDWLHQMNQLMNQLEKTWTDPVCNPEPAAESGSV